LRQGVEGAGPVRDCPDVHLPETSQIEKRFDTEMAPLDHRRIKEAWRPSSDTTEQLAEGLAGARIGGQASVRLNVQPETRCPPFVLELVCKRQRRVAHASVNAGRRTASHRTQPAFRLQPELGEGEEHRETMVRVRGGFVKSQDPKSAAFGSEIVRRVTDSREAPGPTAGLAFQLWSRARASASEVRSW
jgi:hypothetical protein